MPIKKTHWISTILMVVLIAIFFSNGKVNPSTQPDIMSTKELVTFIKENRNVGHLKAFTFVQETIRFNEKEQPQDTSIWYEAIRYPKQFRIDFGNPEDGNANINRNDSIYVFRKNKLVHKGPEIQEFLIMEGGLFYYSTQETLTRLENLEINTSLFSKTIYKNRPTYIIGAKPNEFDKPQIWMDSKDLYVVRRFSKGKQGELYEVRYDDIKNIGGHWIETWIEFYVDGKLIQTERYQNVNIDPKLDDKVFEPTLHKSHYWFDQ